MITFFSNSTHTVRRFSVFEASDLNNTGEIDEEELAILMQKMWQRLGRSMGNVRARLVEEVREHMKAFDKDRSGGLSFHEFLRMLTRKPWRDLLPPQVHVLVPERRRWCRAAAPWSCPVSVPLPPTLVQRRDHPAFVAAPVAAELSLPLASAAPPASS